MSNLRLTNHFGEPTLLAFSLAFGIIFALMLLISILFEMDKRKTCLEVWRDYQPRFIKGECTIDLRGKRVPTSALVLDISKEPSQ